VVAGAAAALPKILNMTVPHVGHLPLMAFRPFFMVSSMPSMMGFLALHLTQYPSDIKKLPPALHAPDKSCRLAANARNVNSKGKSLKDTRLTLRPLILRAGCLHKNKKGEAFASPL
jgi:hypothetical protein